jgi:hypothetical protein
MADARESPPTTLRPDTRQSTACSNPTCTASLDSRSQLRSRGTDIQAARNAALYDLSKQIDTVSLADLLGYSTQIMNVHAARAAVSMATYQPRNAPFDRQSRRCRHEEFDLT